MPAFWTILVSALLLAYPFIVYYSLHVASPAVLGALLAAISVARLIIIRHTLGKESFYQQMFPLGGAILISIIAMLSNEILSLRLTPVIINLGCLGLFAWTLYSPPTMIERFARLVEKEPLSSKAIVYTRKVTILWCCFFVYNSAASFYTAWYTSLEIWMLYNGCISYLLVGLLFAIEYLVRLRVKRNNLM